MQTQTAKEGAPNLARPLQGVGLLGYGDHLISSLRLAGISSFFLGMFSVSTPSV